jgi:hypothetical protein
LRLHIEFPRLTKNRIGRAITGNSLFNAYVVLSQYQQKLVDQGKLPTDARDSADLSAHLKSDGSLDDEILAAKKFVRSHAASALMAIRLV